MNTLITAHIQICQYTTYIIENKYIIDSAQAIQIEEGQKECLQNMKHKMKCLFLEKLLCYVMICIYGSNKQQQLHPLLFIPYNVRFGLLFIFIFELLIIMIHSGLISLIYIYISGLRTN